MKPRSAAPVLGVLLVLPLALASSGCWYDVKSHCPGCTVVDHAATTVPVPAPGTHTEVVMVHGTWGFGSEWTKVVAAVRQYPGFDLMVWSWPGAFRDVRLDAQAFGVELQALVDFLPASVDEVIVLAHSAGAVMTNFSMRQLRVPPGRHVTVALLDPPPFRRSSRAMNTYRSRPGSPQRCFMRRVPPPSSSRSWCRAPETGPISRRSMSAPSGTIRSSRWCRCRSWPHDTGRDRAPLPNLRRSSSVTVA